MARVLFITSLVVTLFSCSNYIVSNEKSVSKNLIQNNYSENELSIRDNIITKLKEKDNDSYITIFYSIKDKTIGDGEEVNILFNKENDKRTISKILFIKRINTEIEEISLQDKDKIQYILSNLKLLKTDNIQHKENINIAIKLLQ